MDSGKKTRAMIESGLLAVISAIFVLAGTYIPILTFILILMPVPFIVVGIKHGIKYNILTVITAAILVGMLTQPIQALVVITTGGLNSIVLAYMIKRKSSAERAIFFGSISSILASVVSIWLLFSLSGVNFIDTIEQAFTLSDGINDTLFKSLGTDAAKIEEMKTMMETSKKLVIMLIPFGVISSSVFMTYIYYIITGVILKKMKIHIPKLKKFSHFQLPRNILMGTTIIFLLTYLIRNLNIVNFETLFVNLLYIFFAIYVVQGLAVASFFMEKRGMGKGVRIVITIILLSIPSMTFIIMFVGLFDVIMNIRKLES